MKNKTVYLIGFMASGKTQLGKKIAKSLEFDWIDLDEYIAQKAGLPVKNIFTFWGEEKFRLIERECLLEIKGDTPRVVSCGGGTPCFHNNIEYMLENGCTVFLNVPKGHLIQRLIANPKNRPLVLNKTEEEVKMIVTNMLEEREPIYKKASIVFDPIAEDYTELIEQIQQYFQKITTPN